MKKPTPSRNQLRAAMSDAGVSQAELARRAGVTKANLSDYLGGKSDVTTETFDRLIAACQAPGCPQHPPAAIRRSSSAGSKSSGIGSGLP